MCAVNSLSVPGFVFLVLFSLASWPCRVDAAAPPPSEEIAVVLLAETSPSTLATIEKKDDPKEVGVTESKVLGPITFDLKNRRIPYAIDGIRLDGSTLSIANATVALRFSEIISKNILIVDVPDGVETKMVREERVVFGQRIVTDRPVITPKMKRVTKETVLVSAKSPALVLKTKKDAKPLLLSLPEKISFEIGTDGKIRLTDTSALVKDLRRSIDSGFSDAILAPWVDVSLENIPPGLDEIVKWIANSKKQEAFRVLRETLSNEVAKPEFIASLERVMATQLPPLAIGKRSVPGTLEYEKTSKKLVARVGLGSAALELTPEDRAARVALIANQRGLNVIAHNYFLHVLRSGALHGDTKLEGVERNQEKGWLLYAPTEDEGRELAPLLSRWNGEKIDARDVSRFGIYLAGAKAPRVSFRRADPKATPKLVMAITTFVVSPRASDTPIEIALNLEFSLRSGVLYLQSIGSAKAETTVKTEKPRYPLVDRFAKKVQLALLAASANQALLDAMKGSTAGDLSTTWGQDRDSRPLLRVVLKQPH